MYIDVVSDAIRDIAGQSRTKSLNYRNGQTFPFRGEKEDIHCLKQGRHIGAVAEHADRVTNSKRIYLLLDIVSKRSFTDKQ